MESGRVVDGGWLDDRREIDGWPVGSRHAHVMSSDGTPVVLPVGGRSRSRLLSGGGGGMSFTPPDVCPSFSSAADPVASQQRGSDRSRTARGGARGQKRGPNDPASKLIRGCRPALRTRWGGGGRELRGGGMHADPIRTLMQALKALTSDDCVAPPQSRKQPIRPPSSLDVLGESSQQNPHPARPCALSAALRTARVGDATSKDHPSRRAGQRRRIRRRPFPVPVRVEDQRGGNEVVASPPQRRGCGTIKDEDETEAWRRPLCQAAGWALGEQVAT